MALLSGRFVIAAVVMWLLVLALGRGAWPTWRSALAGTLIGLAIYASQSAFFFLSVERLDAAFAVLLVYVAPVLVAAGAVAIGRERLTTAQIVAMPVALGGTALVLVGEGVGDVDTLGVAYAFLCALIYAVYMLVSDAAVRKDNPFSLSASVCTGCAIAFVCAAVARGDLPTHAGAHAWALIAALAIISTVVSITTLAAGSARVGPSTAAILSTFEPVVTAVLAFLWFDERLGPLQVVGGILVLSSVGVLHAGFPRRATEAPAAAP